MLVARCDWKRFLIKNQTPMEQNKELEEMISIYALKVEDKPTEDKITESVMNQWNQLLAIERINNIKKIDNKEIFIEYLAMTIEKLEELYKTLLPTSTTK